MKAKAISPVLIASMLLFMLIDARGQQRRQQKTSTQNTAALLPGYEYDSRLFLSTTEKIAFNRQYPDFDEPKAEKNWEWKDVDPLGLFTPEENRKRRRELFLYEYSSSSMNKLDREPSKDQLAFQSVLRSQLKEVEILMSNKTVKLSTPYTELYEKTLPKKNLLEKIAQLGLMWAQVGGTNLYIYNGPILIAKYKVGYVALADLNIDRPAARLKKQ